MCGGCTGEMAGYRIFWLLAEQCTDFWEKEKKQSQSGFIFRFSSGIVFLSVFRTGDYEMYRKNRVLACFVAFYLRFR